MQVWGKEPEKSAAIAKRPDAGFPVAGVYHLLLSPDVLIPLPHLSNHNADVSPLSTLKL